MQKQRSKFPGIPYQHALTSGVATVTQGTRGCHSELVDEEITAVAHLDVVAPPATRLAPVIADFSLHWSVGH